VRRNRLTGIPQLVIVNFAVGSLILEEGADMKYPSALAAVLFTIVGSAHATEFLQNGSFETGDFTDWTLVGSGPPLTTVQSTIGYPPESGKFYVLAGPPSSAPGVLSQTFTDMAGEQLKVSGWAIGDTSIRDGLGDISYFFDGVLLGSPDLSSGKWTESVFSTVATGSDTFSIQFANDNSFSGLDNFSVGSSVPEPSTWILLLIGLIGFGPLVKGSLRASFRSSRAKLT
jgi:hypothetical protein